MLAKKQKECYKNNRNGILKKRKESQYRRKNNIIINLFLRKNNE